MAPFVIRFAIGLLMPMLLTAAAVANEFEEEPELAWQEGAYDLPAAPAEANLRPFFVSAASPNRFMIDAATLTVGADGVVRYVLVIRSAGGAENVTFEGIRCDAWERRIYASGRKDGAWAALKKSAWGPIVDNSYNRPRAALAKDFFCDGPVPPRNRDEVMRRLAGGAPIGEPSRGTAQ